MKKPILFMIGCLFAILGTANAQDGPGLSIGPELALPIGDWGDAYSIGYGGSLKADFPLASAEGLSLTASAGYLSFSPKSEYDDILDNAGTIPLKVGGKYFFGTSPVYGAVELGAAIGTGDNSETAFAWTPGVGVLLGDAFDASIRYESWEKDGSSSFFGLRLAYRFGL